MNIRRVTEADIPRMVTIAEAKRVEYEGYSPVFWRKAPDSSLKQEVFFQRLLTGTDVIALVAETGATLLGFVIGAVTTAPPVYNPGGPVCIVDDLRLLTRWSGGRSVQHSWQQVLGSGLSIDFLSQCPSQLSFAL